MQCLIQQVDGSFLLSSPQPQNITDCVYILAQPNELANTAFSLSASQGLTLALSISGVWAVGLAFRLLYLFLKSETNSLSTME